MMTRPVRFATLAAVLGVAVGLAACGEKAQTSGTARKSDSKVWESKVEGFDAPGYKVADKSAWEAQMRARATGQNEYAKSR